MTAKKSLRGKLAVVIAMYVTLFAAVLAEAEDYADLVEWVMTSMVYVETDKSTGSGFLVSDNDDILTNYHIIKDAKYIIVVPYGCEPVEALVKDFDAERDIALLKAKEIRSSSLARLMIKPSLKISNTLPRIGEAVLAIGNPRGLSGTVSDGIVSAIRQGDNNLWVQFTAPVSPGSTGKSFKAFRANVDTVVVYSFFQDKLSSIHFQINDKRSNQLLQSVITKELTELYRMSPEEEYVAEQYLENGFHIPGKIWRTWKTKGLVVHMSYYDDGGLSLVFGPLQW